MTEEFELRIDAFIKWCETPEGKAAKEKLVPKTGVKCGTWLMAHWKSLGCPGLESGKGS